MSDDDYDMDAYDADEMEYMDDDDGDDDGDGGDDDDGDDDDDDDDGDKKDPKKWTKIDLENQYYKSKGNWLDKPLHYCSPILFSFSSSFPLIF